jgi:regulatory protein
MAIIQKINSLATPVDRVEIQLDDGRKLLLPAELVLKQGLGRGDELSDEQMLRLEEENLSWSAREAALSLLSYRARSRGELEQRLQRKGYPPEVVERCLTELEDRGLVDDASFAASFVRDRIRGKPKGERRISQELRARGIDRTTAGSVISEVMEAENVTEVELARAAADRWRSRPGEEPLRARRRLYGFLMRRGFSGEAVRAVLEERGGSGEEQDS